MLKIFSESFSLGLVAVLMAHAAEPATDHFGFTKFFPTVEGSFSWDSRHWANGESRHFSWSGDVYDSTGWTSDQSVTDAGFQIDGNGVMQPGIGGDSGPRFHINGQDELVSQKQFFKNIEYTGFMKRTTLDGKDWGGFVVGLRSGPHNHGSSGHDDCLATTYYARFKNDGAWDFEKEWKHPNSFPATPSGIGKSERLWEGAFPLNKWIGMKYIVYNLNNDAVHLEVYIDSTSNATPPGKWEKVGEYVDDGTNFSGGKDPNSSWSPATSIEGCSNVTDAFAPILEGGGTVLMRTDLDAPQYQFVTVREINPLDNFEPSEEIRKESRAVSVKKTAPRFDLLGRLHK